MGLTELRKQAAQLKKDTEINLDGIKNAHQKYSAEGRKKSAEQKLEKLLPQVIEQILTDSRTLVIADDVPRKVEGLDKREDSVILDYMAFEKKMVDLIFPKKATTFNFNGSVVDRMNTLLYDHFVQKVNASSMDYFMIKSTNFGLVKTKEEAVAKLGDWIRIAYKGELKVKLLRQELYDATKEKLDFDALTLIIQNVPEWDIGSLYRMTGKTVVLSGSGNSPGSIKVTKDTTDEVLLNNLKQAFSEGVENEQ